MMHAPFFSQTAIDQSGKTAIQQRLMLAPWNGGNIDLNQSADQDGTGRFERFQDEYLR
jgi:hypothetical protein